MISYPTVLVALAAFAVGVVAGRRIDSAVTAIPAGLPWAGRPACAACGRPWHGLARLPLAGPLLARRCYNCGASISRALPLTEAATGALFALATIRRGVGVAALVDAAAAALFIALLLVIARIDWRHQLIFDRTIGWGLLAAFGHAAILSPRPCALIWAAGAAVGAAGLFLGLYLLALVIYRRRALGLGDVLLAGLVGAMTGPDAPLALFVGMVLAATSGLALVALRRRRRQDYLSYGSYLCAGAIAALLWGNP